MQRLSRFRGPAVAWAGWSCLLGCKRHGGEQTIRPTPETARSAAPSARPSADTLRPSPGTSASARAAGPKAGLNTDSDPLAAKYRAPLARARKLQSAGKFAEAELAFIEATGTGQDIYYRAVAELGYLGLTHGGVANDETERTLLVATGSPEPDVQAEAWFNLAGLYAKQGKPEAERAALARSLATHAGPAAKSQLGQRPACVAELLPRQVSPGPVIVSGWVGVCKEMSLCNDAPATSEAEARKRACLTFMGGAVPEQSHGCSDDPPWESTFRYMSYTMDKAFIAPAGSGKFFLIDARIGGWAAICGGDFGFSAELVADAVHVTETRIMSNVGRGRVAPNADADQGLCWDTPQSRAHAVYDLKTGKLLAALSTVEGLPVDVTVDSEQRRLRLSGGGCDGFVPLDGSQRFTAALPAP